MPGKIGRKDIIEADSGFSVRKKSSEQGWNQGEVTEALTLGTKFKGMPKKKPPLNNQDK